MVQDKSKETEFFDTFSAAKEYDVFTPYGYKSIIKTYMKLTGALPAGKMRVIDLGCGTGAFTRKYKKKYKKNALFYGLDISYKSAALAAELSPDIHYCTGDIEQCCFENDTFDVVLFSGVLHHFSDYEPCLREGCRILKSGGCVISYDPNLKNPFMWLYRHPSSPFFSKKGKTDNERLLTAEELDSLLKKTGFVNVAAQCISGVTFRYVESAVGRFLLPLYNLFEIVLGLTPPAAKYGSFVIAYGEKA